MRNLKKIIFVLFLTGMSESIKLVVVGDDGVGKTCLLISYTSNAFPSDYVPTVFDDYSANILVNGVSVGLGLWDTAGAEDYDRLRPLAYPGTDVFLLCYSVVCQTSYDSITTKWINEIRQYDDKVPIVIVGTKIDLRDDTATINILKQSNMEPLTQTQGETLAKTMKAKKYIECSALNQSNLSKTFNYSILCALKYKSSGAKVPKKSKLKNNCIIQ